MRYYETNKYPALCKYFAKQEDMAKAGCMSASRLSNCLSGKSEFTREEGRAICNEILVTYGFTYGVEKDLLSLEEEQALLKAREGNFNEVFRIEDV